MVDKIKAKKEGREGVYLINKEEAIKLVNECSGKTIHNFIGEGSPMLIGCDWSKKTVREFLNKKAKSIALLFEPNLVIGHQLVGLTDDKRYSFDIGKIEKSNLTIVKKI